MKKEKLLEICKYVHRVTLVIGLLTLILPLLFWSKIPDTIPIHYGASGVVDNYADKGSLILLFVAIVMLMGVMNIAIYYVKSNATSKYATEADKSQLDTVYPMIIFMNLSIQVIFAYMMFCCVTGRNLGVWFMPVFLIAAFAPIVFCFVKRKNIVLETNTTFEKQKMLEKQDEGIVYRSKVDWWLGLILIGSMGVTIWVALEPIVQGEGIDWGITMVAILTLLIVLPLFFMKYVLYSDHLYISCGIYGKVRIPYEMIQNIKETHNPLSSMAMSLDRIQIDYLENGVHRMMLISPVRKKEFIEKIEAYRKQK